MVRSMSKTVMGVPVPSIPPDKSDVYLQALAEESTRRQAADINLREDIQNVHNEVKRLDSKFDELKESVEVESKETRAVTRDAVNHAKTWIGVVLAIAASIGPEVISWAKKVWALSP